MKKILLGLSIASILLSACTEADIGIIGGADGPTAIYIGKQREDKYEKHPIRMIMVDGELYYDSGMKDERVKCGSLDGELTKCADEGEVPYEDNGCNFSGAYGYQCYSEIAKVVYVDEEWIFFKKYPYDKEDVLYKQKPAYCFYMNGVLPNSESDWEIVVLADDRNVSFSDAIDRMLGATYDENRPYITFTSYAEHDEWGISLWAETVDKNGAVICCSKFGGENKGEIKTGEGYKVYKNEGDGEWEPLNTISDCIWKDVAYIVEDRGMIRWEINWKTIYGSLTPGYYRLSKTITDFVGTENYTDKEYYTYFTIE